VGIYLSRANETSALLASPATSRLKHQRWSWTREALGESPPLNQLTLKPHQPTQSMPRPQEKNRLTRRCPSVIMQDQTWPQPWEPGASMLPVMGWAGSRGEEQTTRRAWHARRRQQWTNKTVSHSISQSLRVITCQQRFNS